MSMQSVPGLRERKKAKTRATIQRHALRLFAKHGYEATTVSQIAAAAEVSDSTFFRYFPTKEAVVLWDDFDLDLLEAVRTQPVGVSAIGAIRGAFSAVFERLSKAERAELKQRAQIMLSAPPLRALLVDQLDGPMRRLAEAIALRTGSAADEPAPRALAGAIIGVGLAAMYTAAQEPHTDLIVLLDQMLSELDAAKSPRRQAGG